MTRPYLLRALRGEVPERTPVWLMRQAGRHLPGYRALRAQHPILEIARSPELAAEVTLEPLRRYDVDAAVVFADITLPFEGLGVEFSIDPGTGPVVPRPLRTRADVDGLAEFSAARDVPYVGRAIERFLEQEHDRPIVGFAGAPFTLASYLIEGRASRELVETKRLLYRDPGTFDRLIDRLAEMTIDYLRLQVAAGAAALQLFDTWVGALGPGPFERHLLAPLQRIFDALRPLHRPTIYFSTGSSQLLELLARTGADALGVDACEPLGAVRRRVGPHLALQGNLDPAVLLAGPEVVRAEARRVLQEIPTVVRTSSI